MSSVDRRGDYEACVNCEYAGGIVLHYCTHQQSEFFRNLVDWEGWCPQYVPRGKSNTGPLIKVQRGEAGR